MTTQVIISLKDIREAEWLDMLGNYRVKGKEMFYLVNNSNGEWLFKVRVPDSEDKVTVNVVESSLSDFLSDQIKRRIIVFLRYDDDFFFHPITLSSIKGGRLHFKYCRKIADVPNYIIQNFEVMLYKKPLYFGNKKSVSVVIALIPKNYYEKMVKLFIFENIWPVYCKQTVSEEKLDIQSLEEFLHKQGLIIFGRKSDAIEIWDKESKDVAKISYKGEIITCSSLSGIKKLEKLIRTYKLWYKLNPKQR